MSDLKVGDRVIVNGYRNPWNAVAGTVTSIAEPVNEAGAPLIRVRLEIPAYEVDADYWPNELEAAALPPALAIDRDAWHHSLAIYVDALVSDRPHQRTQATAKNHREAYWNLREIVEPFFAIDPDNSRGFAACSNCNGLPGDPDCPQCDGMGSIEVDENGDPITPHLTPKPVTEGDAS